MTWLKCRSVTILRLVIDEANIQNIKMKYINIHHFHLLSK